MHLGREAASGCPIVVADHSGELEVGRSKKRLIGAAIRLTVWLSECIPVKQTATSSTYEIKA